MNSDIKFNEVKIRHIIAMALISVILSIAIADAMNIEEKSFQIIILVYEIMFILMLKYKFKISKEKILLLYKDLKRKIKLKEIFKVVATQICLSMGIVLISIGIIYIISPSFINSLLNEDSVVKGNNFMISFLSVVITAPILEEIVFRGVIFKRLSKKFNVYVGMIVSSIIFGSLHMDLSIVGAALFGVANCMLYVKYKNILIPILVHFLNNLIVMITQILMGNTSDEADVLMFSSNELIMLFIIGGILLIVGLFIFAKFIKSNKAYLKEYGI